MLIEAPDAVAAKDAVLGEGYTRWRDGGGAPLVFLGAGWPRPRAEAASCLVAPLGPGPPRPRRPTRLPPLTPSPSLIPEPSRPARTHYSHLARTHIDPPSLSHIHTELTLPPPPHTLIHTHIHTRACSSDESESHHSPHATRSAGMRRGICTSMHPSLEGPRPRAPHPAAWSSPHE